MPFELTQEVIRVRNLEVLNDLGEAVIRLTTSESGQPLISLIDRRTQFPCICIEVENDRLALGFLATDGSLRARIGCDAVTGGGITIANRDNTKIATLTVDERTDNIITIYGG